MSYFDDAFVVPKQRGQFYVLADKLEVVCQFNVLADKISRENTLFHSIRLLTLQFGS